MIRILGVILFLLPASLVFSQGSDALYKKYQESQQITDPVAQDTSTIRAYTDYAIWQINAKHPKSEAIIDSLQILIDQSEWKKAYGIMLRVRGRYYEMSANMDESLRLYNLAIDTLRNIPYAYEDLSTSLIGAGFVLLNTGLYEKAYQSLKEGYLYSVKANNGKNQWITLNFFGDYFYYSAFRQQQFDSALVYYLKADTIIQKYQLGGYFKADNDLGLSNVYRTLKKEELSKIHFDRSLKVAEENNNYGVIYALHVDQAEILENQGKLEEALQLKLAAYQYAKQSGFIEFIARADQHLYQTFKGLGRYKEALQYYEQYIIAQDSMKKDQASARYAELEAKFENEKKEQQITILQNSNLRQSRNFLIILTFLGLTIAALIGWNNYNLKKKNKELEQKNKEIMLAQLKGQNIERRRMATELHDNLNTKIAAIRWQLEAILPLAIDKVKKVLIHTLGLIEDVYGDVRLISHNLMPEKVEAIGLIPALDNLISQLKQNNKVSFHLVNHIGPGVNFGDLTYPLYNIIFEMINNILKHAEAENGWISLSEEQNSFLITVSDDGKGFDIDQMSNGYGIKNITSRLENINGKWNIESAPGKGTSFYMEIPKIHNNRTGG